MNQDIFNSMVEAVAKINAKPEPVGEWMRKHGKPPEHWDVVIPQRMLAELDYIPAFWPSYVRFSAFVTVPVFTLNTSNYLKYSQQNNISIT